MAKAENQREADVLDEVRILRERIDKECPSSMGWKVVSLLQSLKRQKFDFQKQRSSDCSRLQQEINELDRTLHGGADYEDSDTFRHYFQDCNERLESAKKELGTKLRSIVSLKRQLDEVPSQAELIQYELRLSELNTQIQKKLRQTHKHYDTYNALLEIKELMLKETSLLNSISVQFQNAITSADGRIKLINSLEGILNGTQLKLEKAELALESEQNFCNTIKEKYVAAISEQRQSSSLLKLFQEECARNERLRAQTHEHGQPCPSGVEAHIGPSTALKHAGFDSWSLQYISHDLHPQPRLRAE